MAPEQFTVPWQEVINRATAPLAVLDSRGDFLYVNDALCSMLRYPRETLLRMNHHDVSPPGDDEASRGLTAMTSEGVERRYVRSDGSVLWALASLSRITDVTGHPECWFVQLHDVTRRRDAELLWQRSFANAPIGMALLDLEGRWTAVNDTLCELLGYRRDEMLSKSFVDVTYSEDQNEGLAALEDLCQGRRDAVSMEKRYRHRDGHPIWVLIRSTAVPGADGAPAFLVSQYEEIGERRMVDAHLAHLALHDPLTGLANRALLADRLDHALQQLARDGGVVAVIVIDLDGLKPVNDRYGHAMGDRLLTATANALSGAVRGGDTVARIGGDEFVVVSHVPDEQSARALRHRITDALDTEIVTFGATIQLRASVGLAIATEPVAAECLLHEADLDMYSSKGRNRRH